MFARLALLFFLTLIAEIFLLFWLAEKVGPTLALGEVLLSGAIGALVIRWQGFWTFRKVQQKLAAGETPAGTLVDGLLIFLAGVFLFIPGLITDTLGVLLIIPFSRRAIKALFVVWFLRRIKGSFLDRHETQETSEDSPSSRIIDVEVVDPQQRAKELPRLED